MIAPDFTALVEQLRSLNGLHAKRDIQVPAAVFGHHPFAVLGEASRLGDDAAVVPAQGGSLLLACEGMHPELVNDDPWFAGWSGVLVNLSDIAAMGGRPLALVNSVWSAGEQAVAPLLAGMRFACDKFSIPMVGGHTNCQSPYTALSVAVLGVAEGPVLSARAAQSGDLLVLLIDGDGRFYRHYPFWDAATTAEPSRLQSQLALLPRLAQAGIARAAKDISMGGLVGTAAMFAEACGLGIRIDLDAIPRPPEIDELAWLSSFPSFGFLLAVSSGQLYSLQKMVSGHPKLICASIGSFAADRRGVGLRRNEQTQQLWDGTTSLTGFGAVASP
ncbi:sll0787 family AIR synthase-like protein [Vulcanococcus limneticus]|uniref:sll0787 family AIR synthase-like protein n=1 Tax=Vulcanococcus limneticus TaxID=2170428 RepID=UPI00398BE71B